MTAGAPPRDDFAAFYGQQFDLRVRQVAMKVSSVQDAEDIVQNSLMEMSRLWDRAENPEALLTTIIQRQVYKHWGRAAKDAVLVPLGEESGQLAARVADPAVTAEQRDTLRRVADVMSPMERRIVLGRVQQVSATTIAAQAGVTAYAVGHAGQRMKQRMTALIDSEPIAPAYRVDMNMYVPRLPRRQRQVMDLALDGYQPREIARTLGITANDARVNLRHAKVKVTGMLPDALTSVSANVVDVVLLTARNHRNMDLTAAALSRGVLHAVQLD